jgi:hypothetical protein
MVSLRVIRPPLTDTIYIGQTIPFGQMRVGKTTPKPLGGSTPQTIHMEWFQPPPRWPFGGGRTTPHGHGGGSITLDWQHDRGWLAPSFSQTRMVEST